MFKVRLRDSNQIVSIKLTQKELNLFWGTEEDWKLMANSIHARLGIQIIGNTDLISLNGRPVH
tara:strand:+ start:1304 stop:1492 length:189 start_codon:yes stop_codon:yes gene_type:complete